MKRLYFFTRRHGVTLTEDGRKLIKIAQKLTHIK